MQIMLQVRLLYNCLTVRLVLNVSLSLYPSAFQTVPDGPGRVRLKAMVKHCITPFHPTCLAIMVPKHMKSLLLLSKLYNLLLTASMAEPGLIKGNLHPRIEQPAPDSTISFI